MAELRITHTYEEGTLLDGPLTSEDYKTVLKPLRTTWRWSNTVGWHLRGSRDKPARSWVINQSAEALRAAGHVVEVDIDDNATPMADREKARAERMDSRADALAAKGERRRAEGNARWNRGREVFDAIPFGQPMLVGHHSYKADRRRRERASDNMRQGFALIRDADRIDDRADSAANHMRHRHNPVTVANRIQTLEAALRGVERDIVGREQWVREPDGRDVWRRRPVTGERLAELEVRKATLTDEIEFWRGVRAEQVAHGQATDYSRDTVGPLDLVRYRGDWYPVARVNAKTVTIPSMTGGSWTSTVPYHELADHHRVGDGEWVRMARGLSTVVLRDGGTHKVIERLRARLDQVSREG